MQGIIISWFNKFFIDSNQPSKKLMELALIPIKHHLECFKSWRSHPNRTPPLILNLFWRWEDYENALTFPKLFCSSRVSREIEHARDCTNKDHASFLILSFFVPNSLSFSYLLQTEIFIKRRRYGKRAFLLKKFAWILELGIYLISLAIIPNILIMSCFIIALLFQLF